ncbi:5'/3'-nucleotidase sure [Trichodelitschia bisporula]|uniref:5'/3'-nucleotidase sure n=1 Tax=Trichodelitschia bisporula TaxID=703511 RepID=A0A6G1I5M6_9PEZI|nr:5'/3'-nucleotidase sure [Trichodelitschia bisporula]
MSKGCSAVRLIIVAASLLSHVLCLNIILNNDDGFTSVHIRELYRALNAAGHNAWIAAPAYDQSGRGGTLSFTSKANLTSASDADVIPKGAASYGHDPSDPKIWYYDGTPVTCTLFALDYLAPTHMGIAAPDLVITGPNFGTNPGPFMYTMSGTMGAAYSAIGRGVPALALSADSYGPGRNFKGLVAHTQSGWPDPATIIANLSTTLVNQLAAGSKPLLPPGYGLTVNYPKVTSLKDTGCLYPPFIRTRLTGGAPIQKAIFDPKTGLFRGADTIPATGVGVNTCNVGNCTLPGETNVVNNGQCQTSVSVFVVDYDAPDNPATQGVDSRLGNLVTGENEARNYSAASVGAPPEQPAVSAAASTTPPAVKSGAGTNLPQHLRVLAAVGSVLGVLH